MSPRLSYGDTARSSVALLVAFALLATPAVTGVGLAGAGTSPGSTAAGSGEATGAVGGQPGDGATVAADAGDARGGSDGSSRAKRIEIRSDGERIEYSFQVSGSITMVDTDTEESVDGGSARGVVVDGTDVFEFTGELTGFSADGDPTVVVDGEEIDESTVSAGAGGPDWRTISIASDGQRVNYDFTATGRVEAVDTDTEESVDGGSAEGVVVDGTDVFRFTGSIGSYEDDGSPSVSIDGSPVDPVADLGDTPEQTPETHRIEISSDGERVRYEFDVSGTVEKIDTDTEESVSGGTAEGVVVDGTDVFEYTGSIERMTADGLPSISIDGRSVDPKSLGVEAGPESITYGTSYSGELTDGEDSDRYSFRAEAGQFIRVLTISGSPEAIDARLYGPDGTRLDTHEVYVETMPLGARAPTTGEYTLVFAGDPPGEPDYRFEVTRSSPDRMGDSPADARALENGATRTGTAQEGDDGDYWAIDVPEPGPVTVEVDHESYVGAGLTAELLGPDGERLGRSETNCSPGGGCPPIEFSYEAATSGTHYVRIAEGTEGYVDYSVTASAPTAGGGGGDDMRRIVIEGRDAETSSTYEFTASGEVEPTDRTDTEDEISGATATGVVVDDVDAYRFEGAITDFETEGDVEVRVDGTSVDPERIGGGSSGGGAASGSDGSSTPTNTPRTSENWTASGPDEEFTSETGGGETPSDSNGTTPDTSDPNASDGDGGTDDGSTVQTVGYDPDTRTTEERTSAFGDGFGVAGGLVALVVAVLLGSRLARFE
jgi:hypothetical protein